MLHKWDFNCKFKNLGHIYSKQNKNLQFNFVRQYFLFIANKFLLNEHNRKRFSFSFLKCYLNLIDENQDNVNSCNQLNYYQRVECSNKDRKNAFQ